TTRALDHRWMRIFFWDLRGRAALAAASQSAAAERREQCAEVERAIRRIAHERLSWAAPMATMLQAGLAMLEGARDPAARLFDEAARAFAAADMTMHAAIARRRAHKIGGDDWFVANEIRDCERFTQMFAPA